jgi:hypothetical protein
LLLLHSGLAEHVKPLLFAHVTDVVLHSPVAHTAVALVQVPVCRPSLGIALPAGSLVLQKVAVLLQ